MVFVAHPVRGDITANLARCGRWLKWLCRENPDWAFSVPWFAYVASMDEASNRERGIRDNIVSLSRCDGIVLCGGMVTEGMGAERAAARAGSLWELDLTHLGPEPPAIGAKLEEG